MLSAIGDYDPSDNSDHKLGVVIDNADPLKLERVRVRIPGKFEYPNTADYPWIGPKGTGRTTNDGENSHYDPPSIGSPVVVHFQQDDLHYGFYEGAPITSSMVNEILETNYPNRRGRADSAGNVMYVDKTPGQIVMFLKHGSGTMAQVQDDGSILITGVGESNDVTLQGNLNITVQGTADITVQGAANLTCPDGLTIDANTTINGNVDIQGNVETTGTLTNNGVNVSSTHTHGGVLRGGSSTNTPN